LSSTNLPIAPRQMSEDCGPGAIWISANEESFR
jgi:hypothetical protein